jgi:hypothetical protein
MAKNQLLSNLFPDLAVREAVKKVMANNTVKVENMSTDYSFLDESKKIVFESSGQMCFGSLNFNWREVIKKKPVYLRYIPLYSNVVSVKNRLRWIELGQEMDILPDDIEPQFILDNGLQIDLLAEKLTMSELYLKLTYIRWIRESSVMVNNVITLVDEGGRDFWAAVTYCHHTGCGRIDHSLLPFAGGYPAEGYVKSINRDLGLVIKLHQVSLMPRQADKRIVRDFLEPKKDFLWLWQSETIMPDKHLVLQDRLMLLSSELYPLISCGDVTKAQELAKTLERNNSYVKFEG